MIISAAVERQSVIAELDNLWRQVVESRRPVCAQFLGGADHHVAVMKSLLVSVRLTARRPARGPVLASTVY